MKKFLQLILVALCVATAAQVYAERKVYFDNSEFNWDIKVYLWNSQGSENNGWPGNSGNGFTISADKICGFTEIVITNDVYDKVIFSNNGAYQTATLDLTDGALYNTTGMVSDIAFPKVYFDNAKIEWSPVKVMWWNQGNGGVDMTNVDGQLYAASVPYGCDFLFYNGNYGDGNQTGDIVTKVYDVIYYHTGEGRSFSKLPLKLFATGDVTLEDGGERADVELAYTSFATYELDDVYILKNENEKYATTTDKSGNIVQLGGRHGQGYVSFVDNLGNKYGAKEDKTEVIPASDVQYASENVFSIYGSDDYQEAYKLTVNLEANSFSLGESTGVESVSEDDVNAPVEYFNLQGVRVENPQNGLYIVRQGNKVSKQIIR